MKQFDYLILFLFIFNAVMYAVNFESVGALLGWVCASTTQLGLILHKHKTLSYLGEIK